MKKQYFTYKEALEDIMEMLDGYNGYYCDLHNDVFNSDYYIIGTHQAKQALEEFGTFDAIEKIKQYEMDHYESFITEIDPEKIANMLYYIIGYEVMELDPLNEPLNEVWNNGADDETNLFLIEKIKETMESL